MSNGDVKLGEPPTRPASDDTIDYHEFARRIRIEHPKYKDISDERLTELALEANPKYRSRVRYNIAIPRNTTIRGPQPMKERIAAQVSEYAPSVGATIGSLVGGSAGGPAGAVLGAGIGGGAGSAVGQISRRMAGLPSPPSSRAAAGELTGDELSQMAAEIIGQGVGKVIPKLHGGKVAGVEVPGSAVRKMAIEEGLRLTGPEIATEAGKGSISREVQRISEFGILGRTVAQRAHTEAEKNALDLADRMIAPLSRIPTTPEIAGRRIESALDISTDAFRARGDLYFKGELPKLGKDVPANLEKVIEEAVRIGKEPSALLRPQELTEDAAGVARRTAHGISEPAGKTLPEPTAVKSILDVMSRLKKNATFSEVLEVRQYLTQFLPGPGKVIADEGAESLAKHFEGMLFDVLDESSTKVGGPLRSKWIQARNFWRTGRQIYDSAIVRGLVKKNPELLVKSVKPGDVTNINIIKKALLGHGAISAESQEGREAWGVFQKQYVQSILLKDPEATGSSFNSLLKMKERMNGVGRRQLNAIFNTDPQSRMVLRNLSTFAETMSRIQPEMSRNWGKFIELSRMIGVSGGLIGGAIAGGATGAEYGAIGTAAGLEIIPSLLAQFFYSREATRALTAAMAIPVEQKGAWTAALARAISLAFRKNPAEPEETPPQNAPTASEGAAAATQPPRSWVFLA